MFLQTTVGERVEPVWLSVTVCSRITVVVFISHFNKSQRPFVFVLSVSVIPIDLSMTLLGDFGVCSCYCECRLASEGPNTARGDDCSAGFLIDSMQCVETISVM